MQTFRPSTAHVKFHQIRTLIGSFRWNYIKFQLKNYRRFVSWHWRVMQNSKKDWFVVSKMTKIWWILTWALEIFKIFYFDWFILFKVYNVWPKNARRSYLSWQWKVIQNLKKNWLAVWKMRWGMWQIFTRALESLKIGTLMGSFYPK